MMLPLLLLSLSSILFLLLLPVFSIILLGAVSLDEEVRQLKRARIGKHHDLCRNAAHWRLVVVGYDDRDRLFLQKRSDKCRSEN